MTNAMQITFAATEREKRQAGRRLFRYREPALRRKQWLGMAAFTLMIFAFFYEYGQLIANVGNTLYGNCHLFGDEAGLDTCLAVADSAYQSLRYMLYWLGALLLAVIFFQRWQYGNFIRSMFYPLDGRQ
ncbi:MAG: YcxB family protein, partial [Cardiobacterium sp.]